MISIHSKPESGFRLYDALIFENQLALEVKGLLPVPASISFWLHDPGLRFQSAKFSKEQQAILLTERKDTTPFVQNGMLIMPLQTADQTHLDVIIQEIDTPLLHKMAPEWLIDLQEKIWERFSLIRQIYIDPGTGLYNRRALDLLLPGNSCWKSLFLIATVSRARTIAARSQKIVQLASLLGVISQDPLFYFGQGIFGRVSRQCDRRAALDFSHRLILRLKREGLCRVHVGFSCLTEEGSDTTLYNCRQALLEAERRGPYSLCDISFFHNRDRHPLALPSKQILQPLLRKWRNLDRFGLALFSCAENDGNNELDVALLPADSYSIPFSSGQQLVLLPGYSAERTTNLVKRLAIKINDEKNPLYTIGFCHWPTAAGTGKIDCVRNCRKALLHAGFYEPGAVVAFNALSLNVSGDHYFDEGNYKQAIKEYRAGLEMEPGDINLLNSLGVALAEVNLHRKAIECFTSVLKKIPDNYMALINKGMSCRQTGRDNEAVLCFEKSLQCREHSEQGSLELYLQLGRLYCKREKYQQAVALLKQWQKKKGTSRELTFYKLLGEACMEAGQNKDAIHSLQRSLKIHPGNADSMSMLGLLYVVEGEGAKIGLSLCERAIGIDETEAKHYYRHAAALYALDRFTDALLAVRTALKIRRNNDRAILLRGRIYERLGWLSRAAQSYQRVVNMKSSTVNRKEQALIRLKAIVTQ